MRGDTRPTILLVDDNPQIRSFIRPALEDNGFNCMEAVGGDEAVYQAEASRPDLIVLVIELGDPDMDGLDVCKRIRALWADHARNLPNRAGQHRRPGVWLTGGGSGFGLREKARGAPHRRHEAQTRVQAAVRDRHYSRGVWYRAGQGKGP